MFLRLDSSTQAHSKLVNMFHFKDAASWSHCIWLVLLSSETIIPYWLFLQLLSSYDICLSQYNICWHASINSCKLQTLLFPVWQWTNSELFCLMQLGKKNSILSKGTSKNLVTVLVSPMWYFAKRSLKMGLYCTQAAREKFSALVHHVQKIWFKYFFTKENT